MKAFWKVFFGIMADVGLVMAGKLGESFVEKVRFEAAARQV
jgi:hypothetical protein